MGENNKPFACSIQGCGMTFTNEDHLTVHKKKHDMSLNFGNGQKTSVFVADQTPTPTRFIRNCEEVGLFQDLQNVNPFEEQFRKAAEAAKSGASTIIHEMDPLVGPQPDDMLHTPHVFPLIETVPSGSGAGPGGGHSDNLSIGKEKEKKSLNSSHGEKSRGSEDLSVSLNDSEEIIVLDHMKKTLERREKTKDKVGTSSILSKSSNVVKDVQSKDLVHVVLRMPDGRCVQLAGLPVQSPLPADNTVGPISLSANWPSNNNVPVVNNTTQSSVTVPKQSEEPANGKPQGISLAKLKLKQVLLQNSSAIKAAPKKDHSSISWAGQKELPIPIERNFSVNLPTAKPQLLSFKADNSVISVSHKKSGASAVNRKKRKPLSPEPEDSSEKRMKFLERNRAAASRCREKRKNWIKSLQRKSSYLETNNIALQAEIASLRAEVSQLRASLTAHKDCPVTLMMQQQTSQRPLQEDPPQRQNVQNSHSQQEKKIGTVIRRHNPTLSIASQSSASDPKVSQVNGRVAAGQVLVMSSAQSMASQHGHILQRQQLLPAIGQTAMGTVLLPSTPESANVGVVCDLQAHREVAVSDTSVDKTVAVVVANPTVMHAVQISALNSVPVKLICATPQLTDTIQRSNLKEESATVKTEVVIEKDKRKLSLQEDEETTNAV